MALSTLYLVRVCNDSEIDKSAHGTLDSAKNGVTRFRGLYPTARLIFVQRNCRGARQRTQILHALTVSKGSTAEERRAKAISQILAREAGETVITECEGAA